MLIVAQFYIACAQVKIVDGGNGRPSGMVSIPGVYMGNEPGLFFVSVALWINRDFREVRAYDGFRTGSIQLTTGICLSYA